MPQTAVSNIHLCFKSNDGYPSITDKNCIDKNVHELIYTYCAYGSKDFPSTSGYSLKRCLKEYNKYRNNEEMIHPIIQDQVRYALEEQSYVDDYCSSATGPQILTFYWELPNLREINNHYEINLGSDYLYKFYELISPRFGF